MSGRPVEHSSVTEPWDGRRGCVHIERDDVAIVGRDELADDPPEPMSSAVVIERAEGSAC